MVMNVSRLFFKLNIQEMFGRKIQFAWKKLGMVRFDGVGFGLVGLYSEVK